MKTHRKADIARVTLTRDKAREILLHVSDVQRARSAAKVKEYARVMDAGDWKPWTALIALDRKNDVLNGQHVLAAFLESKLERLCVTISRNHETGDYAGFDKNRKRSAVDDLKYDGVELAGQIKPVATVLWQYERGLFDGTRYLTVRGGAEFPAPSEVVNTVKTHPHIQEHLHRSPVRGGGSYSIGALRAASWVLHQYYPEKAPKFFRSFIEGIDIPSLDHPIARLRQELFYMPKDKKLFAGETLARIFKAWILYSRGQKVAGTSLLKKNEEFPDVHTVDDGELPTVRPEGRTSTKTKNVM